ncbi:MAG: iron-containing redox enzyme family protein [Ramlibacter sp.]|nr:iron-containing redox enzyme family protein [Ramlibacter sp.]
MTFGPALFDPDRFHRSLAQFNAARLMPATPSGDWRQALRLECAMRESEGDFIESLRGRVGAWVPREFLAVDDFMAWFEALAIEGPGQGHPFFDWLADDASPAQLRWFLTQEAAGEAGFEDLLAYTQVRLPTQAKLECARNYWDEMGHGKAAAMHGGMLERMVQGMELRPTIEGTVWESLALGNAMVAMATTRRYAYQSIGALGAIELTAPGRVAKVSLAMRRVGLDSKMRAYFDLHAALDVSHARSWLREVIRPLVEADPACAPHIAEGALMRLYCGQRCFERYDHDLRQPARPARAENAFEASTATGQAC